MDMPSLHACTMNASLPDDVVSFTSTSLITSCRISLFELPEVGWRPHQLTFLNAIGTQHSTRVCMHAHALILLYVERGQR